MASRNKAPALPAYVRAAGRDAAESYMDFFDRQGVGCASNYRSVSRRFFGWAEQQGVSFSELSREHVDRFHRLLWNEAGPNVAATNFSVIRRLLAHMHAQGGLPNDPAAGVSVRGFTPFKRVRGVFREQWKGDATEDVTQAAMVMIAPAILATFSLKAIRAWSQYPLTVVEDVAAKLYRKGIWWKDETGGGMRCEWLDPECEHPDFAILFDAFVVVGIFDRDDQLRYSLPAKEYGRRKAGSRGGRKYVERTIREVRREVVTVREASERIVESE